MAPAVRAGCCIHAKDEFVVDIDDIERTELALRDHSDAILRTVPEPLIVLDADLRMHSANEAFFKTFKVSPAESKGRLIYELGNRQWDIPRLRELLEEVLPRNSFFDDYEITHDFERIGRRTMLLNARTLVQAEGKTQLILLGIRDVTEALLFQAELRQSEARKTAILKSALDAIVSMDHNGDCVEFNDAAQQMFGYSRAQALGKPVADLIIPARLRERHREGTSRFLATGRGSVLNRRIEMPALRADGTEFPVELAIAVVEGSSPSMFTAFLRDITERKRTEEALRRSQVRDEALVQAASQIVWTMDTGGAAVEDSPSWRAFTGQSYGQWKGFGWLDALHPDDRDRVKDLWQRAVAAGTPLETEYRIRHAGGDWRWTAVYAAPVLEDGGGAVREWVGMNIDISERKQAEEQLRRSHAELRTNAEELARFNRVAVGRETRMIELKKEINELCRERGQDARYPLEFDEEGKHAGD
jgi:PAS domain S-box-containing protein